jgi:hypothetical protein
MTPRYGIDTSILVRLVSGDPQADCGLLDRLIADDYRRADLITLTLDRKMASLPKSRRL